MIGGNLGKFYYFGFPLLWLIHACMMIWNGGQPLTWMYFLVGLTRNDVCYERENQKGRGNITSDGKYWLQFHFSDMVTTPKSRVLFDKWLGQIAPSKFQWPRFQSSGTHEAICNQYL